MGSKGFQAYPTIYSLGGFFTASSKQDKNKNINVINNLLFFCDVGAKYTNAQRIGLVRKTKVIHDCELTQFLQENGITHQSPQDLQKLTQCSVGQVQILEFYFSEGPFKGRISTVKCKRVQADEIKVIIHTDMVEILYELPHEKRSYSASGLVCCARNLNESEKNYLSEEVSHKVEQIKNQFRAIQI